MNKKGSILRSFADGKKKIAVLIDPDKHSASGIRKVAILCREAGTDYIFYGGSLLTTPNHGPFLEIIKEHCPAPLILFPGNHLQLNEKADAILLLSLISGRNPEMLIGKHVVAAPFLKQSRLEILPTGYLLIDTGKPTAVSYMSHTIPIPGDKDEIASCTAMAGEMLGLKLAYLDAGSGAARPVSPSMIRTVRRDISVPLIIGGGIRNAAGARKAFRAGADVVVVGNAIEKEPGLIGKLKETTL